MRGASLASRRERDKGLSQGRTCYDSPDVKKHHNSSPLHSAEKHSKPSPPIKREDVPQRDLLPVFAEKQNLIAQNKNGNNNVDMSILDIISEIDDPSRVNKPSNM